MYQVLQDKFGEGNGNCFQACLASILERPLKDCIDISYADIDDKHWISYVNDFLAPFGLFFVPVDIGKSEDTTKFKGYQILIGKSERGIQHAVVGKNGKCIHDPFPEGKGLESISHIGIFGVFNPVTVKVENTKE